MDTKGERREKKRNSLKKKSSDNRKSINLIIDLIKRSKALKKIKIEVFTAVEMAYRSFGLQMKNMNGFKNGVKVGAEYEN
ncbi:MAG: hypothetical protein CM15mP129_07400 [Chloroflexota bacterium]|nr:MAG: hypothetical protein CM15mP129_07400 [Chloroflexota bacterium]